MMGEGLAPELFYCRWIQGAAWCRWRRWMLWKSYGTGMSANVGENYEKTMEHFYNSLTEGAASRCFSWFWGILGEV